MSYEYAGSLFDTKHDAQMDCVHDWMTSLGSTPTVEALTTYWDDTEHMADELGRDHVSGDWRICYLDEDCDRSDVADLLEDWEEWARGYAIWQARDDLDMTQSEFADALYLSSQQLVSDYENHTRTPNKRIVVLAGMMVERGKS